MRVWTATGWSGLWVLCGLTLSSPSFSLVVTSLGRTTRSVSRHMGRRGHLVHDTLERSQIPVFSHPSLSDHIARSDDIPSEANPFSLVSFADRSGIFSHSPYGTTGNATYVPIFTLFNRTTSGSSETFSLEA